MQLDKLIGDEASFAIEHRLLNVLLLLGIGLAFISTIINYVIGLELEVTIVCGLITLTLICFYYCSKVMSKYWVIMYLAVFTCIFIVTPLMWIYNGGLLGGSTFNVILFSSMIALLLKGIKRIIAIGCLIGVIILLVVLDYNYPLLIVGYSSKSIRYIDVSTNLILILITNASGFALFMNYYIKEQNKSREYLVQIEKQKTENALSRLDKLNLIGEMAASIGHEVRNPLTTARGFLQYFIQKNHYKPEHKEHFITIIEELDRANSIITEFLSLSKNKALNRKPEDLNSVIEALLPLMQANANQHNQEVVFIKNSAAPNVLIDSNEMRQLILNLVKNGIEAMGNGGVITICTRVDNGDVILEIKDQGIGIPSEVMDRIGIPFFTTKESGSGIGLAICYRIAERNSGSISISSSVNGTTVQVKFESVLRDLRIIEKFPVDS